MSKLESCFPTWQEALKACWTILGKEELFAYEINNWFYDRKVKVKGARCYPSPVATSRYDPKTSNRDPEVRDRVFYKAIRQPLKAMNVEDISPEPLTFGWKKKWKYIVQGSEQGRSSRDVIVISPLMAEINRLEAIVDNVKEQIKAVRRQGATIIADLIDTDFVQQTILEARNDLRTKASQRITALGHMGCGKSTTLNLMLSSSILDANDYRRTWEVAFPKGFEEKPPTIFTQKYFDSSVSSEYPPEDITFCPISSSSEEHRSEDRICKEKEVMENIRNLTGNQMKAAQAKRLKSTFLGDSKWAFILPAGNKTDGTGGVTVNCFNLRFGPFALRVMTKSEAEIRSQIFRLGEMMRHPDYDERLNGDASWRNEAEALGQVCKQLCGLDMQGNKQTIKNWKSRTEIKFLDSVLPNLGKIWIYVGNGQDIDKDRLYIRDKLNSWIEGRIPQEVLLPEAGSMRSGEEVISLQSALEPFDIWLPCDMLDEYCCLSDIPGCGDPQATAYELMYDSLRSSKSLIIFSGDPCRGPIDRDITSALCDSGKLLSVLDNPDDYNLIFIDVAEKSSATCGRFVIEDWVQDLDALNEHRQTNLERIKNSFRECTGQAINNTTLWPHLGEQTMSKKIEEAEQALYKEKIEPAAERVKHFEVYPITFYGLRNLSFDQLRELIMDDEIMVDGVNFKKLMELTSIPSLVETFRRILIEGSISVRNELRKRLNSVTEDLKSMEDLIDSDQPQQIKDRVSGLLATCQNARKRKITLFSVVMEDYSKLFCELQSEMNKFEDSLLHKLPSVSSELFDEFTKKLKSSVKTKRCKTSVCDFINSSPRADRNKHIVDLLRFLFGDVADRETFSSDWKIHVERLQTIVTPYLSRCETHLQEAYEGNLPEPYFKSIINAKVKMTLEAMDKILASTLQKYAESHSIKTKTVTQILHNVSQSIIFSALSSDDKANEGSVRNAIISKMQTAIDEGILGIMAEPSAILKRLSPTDGGEEYLKVYDVCESNFEKTLKSVSRIGDKKGIPLLKQIVGQMRSDLDLIKQRVCSQKDENFSPRWDPLRTIGLLVQDDTLVQGQLKEPSMKTRDGIAHFYYPTPRSGPSHDPQGLYRSLAYSKYRRDDQEFVENLCARMCHYTIEHMPMLEDKLKGYFAVSKSKELHKAVCTLFFGGPAGTTFVSKAVILIFSTMENACIKVYSEGSCSMQSPDQPSDTLELGFLSTESLFVALVDSDDVDTEPDSFDDDGA